jgi:hypothetical protein
VLGAHPELRAEVLGVALLRASVFLFPLTIFPLTLSMTTWHSFFGESPSLDTGGARYRGSLLLATLAPAPRMLFCALPSTAADNRSALPAGIDV